MKNFITISDGNNCKIYMKTTFETRQMPGVNLGREYICCSNCQEDLGDVTDENINHQMEYHSCPTKDKVCWVKNCENLVVNEGSKYCSEHESRTNVVAKKKICDFSNCEQPVFESSNRCKRHHVPRICVAKNCEEPTTEFSYYCHTHHRKS